VSAAAALPPLLEAAISLLVVLGALLAALGSVGLLRLGSFNERVHPPTMGTTLGTVLILAGSMLYFGGALHEILIAVFMTVSTPVTYLILGRAALQRERRESGN
jgi:multicomponent K+:H+ antiporter subunit G